MPEHQVKLRCGKNRQGQQLVCQARIVQENGRLELNFGYKPDLIAEVKVMDGARYHGFEQPNPRKVWSVRDCRRNWFQLDYLQGKNPYARFDKQLVEYTPNRWKCLDCKGWWLRKQKGHGLSCPFCRSVNTRPLSYDHQIDLTRHGLTTGASIWAAEMGCISGNATVHCNRASRGFQISLAELCFKFHGGCSDGGKVWDETIPTYIRSLCDGVLRLNKIKYVLYKGKKQVVKITTSLGHTLICTPDHEIAIAQESYQQAKDLKVQDQILCNGVWIDKDGYMRVGGLKNKHPRWTTGGVYEHILIMERHLGRYLEVGEEVHHLNRVRHDNRLSNLELKTTYEHRVFHGKEDFTNLHNGKRVQFHPHQDTVVSIEDAGIQEVYDVVCDDPYRNFVADNIIVHNCGKTLAAIELLEARMSQDAFRIGPKSALYSVSAEFNHWQAMLRPKFHTYEGLKKVLEQWRPGTKAPKVVIFDESSRVKTPTAQRSLAALHLAEQMRDDWGEDCSIILMSGTPAPKSPADWWMQTEIACPGFIREGQYKHFQKRLGFIQMREAYAGGGVYPHLVTWWDNEKKCKHCGQLEEDANHDPIMCSTEFHAFEPSINEVSYLYERMKGLVVVKLKKDCLELPDYNFRRIQLKPSRSVLNAARLIVASEPRAAQALIRLRELSDGFQYEKIPCGMETCDLCFGHKTATVPFDAANPDLDFPSAEEIQDGHRDSGEEIRIEHKEAPCERCKATGQITAYKIETRTVACPKEDALKEILDEHDEIGRIVMYGGFTGSIDRCVDVCKQVGWDYIRVDGRGWSSSVAGNAEQLIELFQRGQTTVLRLAFIGQPGAAGMGLNLTASPTVVFYSNDFNAESRIQAMARIHRLGMDLNLGATVIDLCHLPTDVKVIENLDKKQDLQAMSLGQMKHALESVNETSERTT